MKKNAAETYTKFAKFLLETHAISMEWNRVYSYSKREEGESITDVSVKFRLFGSGQVKSALGYMAQWEEGILKKALLDGRLDMVSPEYHNNAKIKAHCAIILPVIREFLEKEGEITLSASDFLPDHVREMVAWAGASPESVKAMFKSAPSLDRPIPPDRNNILYWREKYLGALSFVPEIARQAVEAAVMIFDEMLSNGRL